MSTASKPLGQAMYVATTADRRWLLNEQKKLYLRSWTEPSFTFRKLWGLVTDPHNLRCAFSRVAGNRGRRTAGMDGKAVHQITVSGADRFLEQVRTDLRSGAFHPSPVRRVRIPKRDKPGEFRPLGIPTVADRVVQAAMKNIMEPIFEAGFYPNSYGFRPGLGVHSALEHLRLLLNPQPFHRPKAERLYLKRINPILRGWGNFYRHARGAGKVFNNLDNYLWRATLRWLRKKHPKASTRAIVARYGRRRPGRRSIHWQDKSCEMFRLSTLRVERFRLSWLNPPSFTETSMESPVRIERRTPGSEEGALETAG